MCITHRSKVDTDKVMHVVCSTKQKGKSLKMEKLFANITYYKLGALKHFGYYIISLTDKGYGVSSTKETLN